METKRIQIDPILNVNCRCWGFTEKVLFSLYWHRERFFTQGFIVSLSKVRLWCQRWCHYDVTIMSLWYLIVDFLFEQVLNIIVKLGPVNTPKLDNGATNEWLAIS